MKRFRIVLFLPIFLLFAPSFLYAQTAYPSIADYVYNTYCKNYITGVSRSDETFRFSLFGQKKVGESDGKSIYEIAYGVYFVTKVDSKDVVWFGWKIARTRLAQLPSGSWTSGGSATFTGVSYWPLTGYDGLNQGFFTAGEVGSFYDALLEFGEFMGGVDDSYMYSGAMQDTPWTEERVKNWPTYDTDGGGVADLYEWIRGSKLNDWSDDEPCSWGGDCVCGACCSDKCACGKWSGDECDHSILLGGCFCHGEDPESENACECGACCSCECTCNKWSGKTCDETDGENGCACHEEPEEVECICAEACCLCHCECTAHESGHGYHGNGFTGCDGTGEGDGRGCSCHTLDECTCVGKCIHCCDCPFHANDPNHLSDHGPCSGTASSCDCHNDVPDCVCANYCCECVCQCPAHADGSAHGPHRNGRQFCDGTSGSSGCSCHGACVCSKYCCIHTCECPSHADGSAHGSHADGYVNCDGTDGPDGCECHEGYVSKEHTCGDKCQHCCSGCEACAEMTVADHVSYHGGCDGTDGSSGCECHASDDPDPTCVCSTYCCIHTCACPAHADGSAHGSHRNGRPTCDGTNGAYGCSCHYGTNPPETQHTCAGKCVHCCSGCALCAEMTPGSHLSYHGSCDGTDGANGCSCHKSGTTNTKPTCTCVLYCCLDACDCSACKSGYVSASVAHKIHANGSTTCNRTTNAGGCSCHGVATAQTPPELNVPSEERKSGLMENHVFRASVDDLTAELDRRFKLETFQKLFEGARGGDLPQWEIKYLDDNSVTLDMETFADFKISKTFRVLLSIGIFVTTFMIVFNSLRRLL